MYIDHELKYTLQNNGVCILRYKLMYTLVYIHYYNI